MLKEYIMLHLLFSLSGIYIIHLKSICSQRMAQWTETLCFKTDIALKCNVDNFPPNKAPQVKIGLDS